VTSLSKLVILSTSRRILAPVLTAFFISFSVLLGENLKIVMARHARVFSLYLMYKVDVYIFLYRVFGGFSMAD
jgi:hypothetical protein